MNIQTPVRLGPAEEKLIAQLDGAGAGALADQLRARGLPTRRVEAYHYTDLKMLLRDVPDLPVAGEAAAAPALRVAGAFRLLVADGDVQAVGTPPAGVIVGDAEGSALSERDDPIVSINRALSPSTLTVRLESSVDPVVHIDRRATGVAGHVTGSVLIDVADGATATVLESCSGTDEAHLTNFATKVNLGNGAKLLHIVVDLSGDKVTRFHTLEYDFAADSHLHGLIVNSGSALSRTQIFGSVNGEGTHVDLNGLNLVNGGQHCDITMDLTHAVPNTTSQEKFKVVAREKAKAVFQGKILVAQNAQKTDAKMMMQGLMLGATAEILSKPELEIYADDVVCGHGSTCGDLDHEAMFYLMSRGVPRNVAESMLIRAFVQELLDPIEDAELNEALSGVVEEWLAQEGQNLVL